MKRFITILLCLIGFANVSFATVLSDKAAQMQPGTWAQISTNNISSVLGANGASGMIFGYTEYIKWEPISRRLFFVGGDHNDQPKFVSYTESSNNWQTLTKESWMVAGTGSAMHGYDHSGIDPATGAFYHRPYNSRNVYRYLNGTWTALPAITGSIMGYNSCCAGVEYFPEMKGLIYVSIESGTNGTVILWDQTTNTWKRLASGLPMGDYHNFAEYNPVHKVVLFGGGNGNQNIYKLSASGQVTSLGLAPIGLGVQTSIVTVDPATGEYLIFTSSQQFYKYDIVNNSWKQQSGTVPIWTSSYGNSIHGVVATSISTYNVNLFVSCNSGANCTVNLYKNSSSSTPPPPPPPTDTIPPTVSFTTPSSGTTLSGTVSLTASASDNVGVTGVQFKMDGANLGTELTSSSYSYAWNTTTASNGSHTLSVVARDAAGYQSTAQVTVTISNRSTPPPTGGGLKMPTLDDERKAYQSWGWTWSTSKEPNFSGDSSYTVSNPDIHGDTEGDDLWTYIMMYRRTGQKGYLDRANAWARYFKQDYRSCVGDQYRNFCYDRDAFGADHLWGWGLIALYEYNGDAAALAEAENIGGVVEGLYAANSPFGCLPNNACTHYGIRQAARHLLIATRLAEVTSKSRWVTLRDKILNLLMASSEWDAARGMYFFGNFVTDEVVGAGAWAAGARIVSAFQIGVLAEAFSQAYRMTSRVDIKNRMIAMAHFVDQYGLDPTYQYTASFFGIVNGHVWHSYSATQPVTSWDPVYTTDLVNTLVWGYKFTGEINYYNRAKYFFNRGTKGVYGSPTQRAAADNVVHHFVDTIFDSSTGNVYLAYNKGELQYTYALFENPGAPSSDTTPPPPPTGLIAN